jgi:hypothetical protein
VRQPGTRFPALWNRCIYSMMKRRRPHDTRSFQVSSFSNRAPGVSRFSAWNMRGSQDSVSNRGLGASEYVSPFQPADRSITRLRTGAPLPAVLPCAMRIEFHVPGDAGIRWGSTNPEVRTQILNVHLCIVTELLTDEALLLGLRPSSAARRHRQGQQRRKQHGHGPCRPQAPAAAPSLQAVPLLPPAPQALQLLSSAVLCWYKASSTQSLASLLVIYAAPIRRCGRHGRRCAAGAASSGGCVELPDAESVDRLHHQLRLQPR